MIKFNFKNIETLYYGKLVIQDIRKGAQTIWEAIKGCFGKGFWRNTRCWINYEGWKNLN